MAIQIGQAAPDFTLWNSEKQQIKLSDLKGKNVLILFFPLAFTGVCTKELCSMRDNMNIYNGLNAEILGISIDTPQSLARFKADQELPFNLLSDFNKEVSAAYGAQYETFVLDMKGVAKRSAFVVDKEGNIQYAEVLENAGDLPNFEAIQQCLAGLQ